MANRNTQGYGLIPVATLGNTPSTQGQSAYKIEAAYGTSIYNGCLLYTSPSPRDRG